MKEKVCGVCLEKLKYRLVDGELVQQPHECEPEPNWAEFKAEQLANIRD